MSTLQAPVIPDLPIYQLSVEQYHELLRAGVLADDDRVELLNGWMVPKMSNNPPHSAATHLSVSVMRSVVPRGFYVRSESPITLSGSEPEPDVAVVIGDVRQYVQRHPGAREVELVMEISDSTLSRDRTMKKQIYAEAGIPCYWILDIARRTVEVYTQPEGSNYQHCEEFTVRVPLKIGDHAEMSITVADMLP